MAVHLVNLTPEDIVWPFSGEQPHFRLVDHMRANVDPFPCYPHDTQVITDTLTRLRLVAPPKTDLHVYVAPREDVGRTNGWASYSHDKWVAETEDEAGYWKMESGVIYLSGKRTPPHPAMTRYLVAHEYGHCVAYWLSRDVSKYKEEIIEPYAKIRGLEYNDQDDTYGGGRWHDNVGEIFACDFRLFAAVEIEYWPHPGIERPENIDAVQDFWMTATNDLIKGVDK